MRTNIILVDFESVQPEEVERLAQDHFRVLVFIGANQAKLPFELAASMQRLGSRAEYIKISGNGPNALDFHIAFYIGNLAAQEHDAYFHVISKDKGFDPLIQHLKSRKIFCARCTRIEDIPLLKSAAAKSPGERAELFLAKLARPKATRPRSEKTLRSAIASLFNKQLSEADVSAVIEALRSDGVNVAEGKVTYAAG